MGPCAAPLFVLLNGDPRQLPNLVENVPSRYRKLGFFTLLEGWHVSLVGDTVDGVPVEGWRLIIVAGQS